MTGRGSSSTRGEKGRPGGVELRMASSPVAGLMVFRSGLSMLMAKRMDPSPAAIIGSMLARSWSRRKALSS